MKKILITKDNFDSRKFLKNLKTRFEVSSILCRLRITKFDIESNRITNDILGILKKTFDYDTTFTSGNLFYIIEKLEEFFLFSKEFQVTVATLTNGTLLTESHTTYITKKTELLKTLAANFENPKILTAEEIKTIYKDDV